MNSWADREAQWRDYFQRFSDWEARYRGIIELGKKSPPFSKEMQVEENRVKGCVSRVWIIGEWDDSGNLQFHCESDALITKGLCTLLCAFYSGRSALDILQHDPAFFFNLGLTQGLTVNRAGGFMSMIQFIKRRVLTMLKEKASQEGNQS